MSTTYGGGGVLLTNSAHGTLKEHILRQLPGGRQVAVKYAPYPSPTRITLVGIPPADAPAELMIAAEFMQNGADAAFAKQ